jgi:hypothetical protein
MKRKNSVHCRGRLLRLICGLLGWVNNVHRENVLLLASSIWSAKIDVTVLFHQSHMSLCMETSNWMNRTLGFSCHCRNTASVLHHQGVSLSPPRLCAHHFSVAQPVFITAKWRHSWKIVGRFDGERERKAIQRPAFASTAASLEPTFRDRGTLA